MSLMYRFVQTPVIGLPQPNDWAQIIINADQNLTCAFSVSGEQASEFGRRCASEFIQLHPISALELHQAIENMLEQATQAGLHVQLAACLLLEEKCVLVTHNGNISLRRQGKVGQLLSSQEEVKVIEGSLKLNDVFLIATAAASDFLAELHQQLLHGADGEALASYLAPRLENHAQSSLIAVSYALITSHSAAPEYSDVPVTTGAQKEKVTTETEISETKTASPQSSKNVFRSIKMLPYNFFRIFSGIKNFFQSFFSNDVYVRHQQRGKFLKIFLPIVLILLIGGGVLFWMRQDRANQLQEAAAFIQPAEAKIADIKTQVDQDPITARQQTEQVIADLQADLPKLEKRKLAYQALQEEIGKIQDFYKTISGRKELDALPPFFNLQLVQSDFIANKVDVAAKTMLFLDGGQRKLIALDIEKKQHTSLPTNDYPSMDDFSFDGDNVFVLGGGIYSFDLTNTASQSAKKVRPPDSANTGAQFIRSFGKNIYVLNKSQKNIFRYAQGADKSYADPVSWVKSTQGLNFDDVSGFSVDGDIWLGFKDGTLKRFTSGKEVPFAIQGLKENFSTPISLFTKDGVTNLYVLEPQKNRLVILSKTGQFLKEVKSNSLSTATAAVASEPEQKAYALSGSLVYEIGL